MNERLKGLSDFEWGSVGQYLVWITSACGLVEVSDGDIWNFPLARFGLDKLLARKECTLRKLEANMESLTKFVGKNADSLTPHELEVLRSFYRSTASSLGTVKGHIGMARELHRMKQEQLAFEVDDEADVEKEITDYDLPF